MTKKESIRKIKRELKRGSLTEEALSLLLEIPQESVKNFLDKIMGKGVVLEKDGVYSLIEEKTNFFDKFSLIVMFITHYGGGVLLALANIRLFEQMSSDSADQLILQVSAIVFALGEIAIWDYGRMHQKKGYMACGIAIALFSFIASAAIGLSGISEYTITKNDYVNEALKTEIQNNEQSIQILSSSLEAIPPERVDRRLQLLSNQSAFRKRNIEILQKLEDEAAAVGSTEKKVEIFVVMGKWFHWDVGTIALLFLLFRAIIIEVVVLATTPIKRRE